MDFVIVGCSRPALAAALEAWAYVAAFAGKDAAGDDEGPSASATIGADAAKGTAAAADAGDSAAATPAERGAKAAAGAAGGAAAAAGAVNI